jgi:hypothetical protein
VEHFHRLAHVRLEDVHRAADEFAQRRAIVGQVDPDEAAVADLALHLAHRRVFLGEAALVALLGARDVDAVPAAVERPLVEDARHALGVARRVVQDRVTAVRADVVEGAYFVVVAAHHDERHAGRVSEEPVVVRCRHLRLVAGEDPGGLEELLLLFFEYRLVRVEARIDVMRFRELRLRFPLGCGLRHARTSRFQRNSVPRALPAKTRYMFIRIFL